MHRKLYIDKLWSILLRSIWVDPVLWNIWYVLSSYSLFQPIELLSLTKISLPGIYETEMQMFRFSSLSEFLVSDSDLKQTYWTHEVMKVLRNILRLFVRLSGIFHCNCS